MQIAFFMALRGDVQHFLHASSLVREASKKMPGVPIIQLTDEKTSIVAGVSRIISEPGGDRPLLDLRLSLYAHCHGETLLVDTDVSIRNDVRGVFDDKTFDVALCDRNWPNQPQGDTMMHTMPFNTGVVFSRSRAFWVDVQETWRAFPQALRDSWLSEQQAVYEVVRRGKYLVKILPGLHYNYPPRQEDDIPVMSALVHYKGNRKTWLSTHAYKVLGAP